MSSVTIIGTGLAGYNLAKEIRKLNKEIPLTLVTADGGESYSKPMLSNAITKGKTAQQLVISDADKMAAQLDAKIYSRTSVQSIDLHQKTITTDTNEIAFDNLVLAVGASQRKLPITGNAADAVMSVNDLDDYHQFRSELEAANKVAIIGAGLIGCEFANDLLSSNKEITVIGSADTPLDRLLLPEIGQRLKAALQDKGINWRLGVRAEKIEFTHGPEKYQVTLSDKTMLDTDLVVSATGLAPNIKLANEAGLQVNKGIMVNQYLQTSAEGIYALGDCIEINSLVLAYVLPIMNCARALAKTLTGQQTKVTYPAMPVVVKTPDYPMVIAPPASNDAGQWQLESDSSGIKALFTGEDNQLKGFVLTDQKISEKQSLAKLLPMTLG